MKTTLLALSVLLIGCGTDATGTTGPDTNLLPDAGTTQSSSATVTATHTTSETVTTTNITTSTRADAGTTPDTIPLLHAIPDSSVPDAQVQVTQPDALPVAQDTLPATRDTFPQVTPDTQIAQQPDVLPMAADTKPATPDVLPVVDTKPVTPDTLPATPDMQPAGDTVTACGGDNQACCVTQAVDRADSWIHTCNDSVRGTYDCNIPTTEATGTIVGYSTLQVPSWILSQSDTANSVGKTLEIGSSFVLLEGYYKIVSITLSGSYISIVTDTDFKTTPDFADGYPIPLSEVGWCLHVLDDRGMVGNAQDAAVGQANGGELDDVPGKTPSRRPPAGVPKHTSPGNLRPAAFNAWSASVVHSPLTDLVGPW